MSLENQLAELKYDYVRLQGDLENGNLEFRYFRTCSST